MKIFATNIQKGGVGKTTITYNGAYYLAQRQGQRVLVVDMDDSCNMTNRFRDSIETPVSEISTVRAFFTGGLPQPLEVGQNIDLIAGDMHLSDLTREVEQGAGRGYLLNWYYKNQKQLDDDYDFILFDTHNDFSIFTDNVISLADVVIAIADIDEDAITKLAQEESHIESLKDAFKNPMTGESFVSAQLVKIGNKVQSNTRDSHEFRAAFEQMMKVDPNFLGYFEFRSLFAQTKTTGRSLVELEPEYQRANYREFFTRTWKLYDRIFDFNDTTAE